MRCDRKPSKILIHPLRIFVSMKWTQELRVIKTLSGSFHLSPAVLFFSRSGQNLGSNPFSLFLRLTFFAATFFFLRNLLKVNWYLAGLLNWTDKSRRWFSLIWEYCFPCNEKNLQVDWWLENIPLVISRVIPSVTRSASARRRKALIMTSKGAWNPH